jgi:hypothetical protein
MDAKHVGGVNVMGGMQPSILDSYFDSAAKVPADPPFHTSLTAGKTDIPMRSVTTAGSLRRPSLSFRRSFSNLRRKSVSQVSDTRNTSPLRNQSNMAVDKSDDENLKSSVRPLRLQSSMSRLRQRVGLDKDLYEPTAIVRPATSEPKASPEPMQKHQRPLRSTKSFSRVISPSPPRSTESELPQSAHPPLRRVSDFMAHRQSPPRQQVSTVQRRTSPTTRTLSLTTTATIPFKQPPVRPKRADSGTAIDFHHVPTQERPSPFQEIMAVQSLAERMEMYKKTREYWASADHGLVEWTGRASGPRKIVGHV